MFRLRIAVGVASSLVAVAALTIILAGRGEAQGTGTGNGLPSGPNVTVVNTPLPVTGNVTATLAGGGVVQAQQSGPWTVGLTPGTTVAVVPTLQPFFIDGQNNTVPAGKTWVLDHYAVSCDADATGVLTDVAVQIFVPGGTALFSDHAVPHFLQANGFSGGKAINRWVASANTHLYAPAGSQIGFSENANFAGTGTAVHNCSETASGYAIDTP
jgi:hypothetical protein